MDIAFVIINAITVAAIYGLIAIAVSITWSSLGLVNLAYGFIFSFAGYAAWLVSTRMPKSPFLIAWHGHRSPEQLPESSSACLSSFPSMTSPPLPQGA